MKQRHTLNTLTFLECLVTKGENMKLADNEIIDALRARKLIKRTTDTYDIYLCLSDTNELCYYDIEDCYERDSVRDFDDLISDDYEIVS